MRTLKPAKLSIEDGTALLLAGLATALCVGRGWFDHLCMALRHNERYELDEYVGGSVVFLAAAVFMFIRRERQLRKCLAEAASRELDAHKIARHDNLTGLANRLALVERLNDLRADDVAFLLIDLDGFKGVNDRHGHAAGDQVLKEVSRRLLRISDASGGLVARLGGDEFGYLLTTANPRKVASVGEQIIQILLQPIDLSSGQVAIGASVGSAISIRGHRDTDELLQSADAAMYRSKSLSRAGIRRPIAATSAPLAASSQLW